MKIKTKWGFIGNAVKLNADSNVVKAGQTFDAEDEYAHVLIGKGLVEAVTGAKPAEDKALKPDAAGKVTSKADKQAKAGETK